MKKSIIILIFTLIHIITTAQCVGTEPALFLGNDTSLCPGASITLQAVNGYDNYIWSNNSTAQTLNVSTAGTYFVEATITTGGTNLVVNVDFEKSDPLIFVPNCFTPDGDSHNNNRQFYLNGFDEEKFNVKIFNRWGEMVWDGRYNNKLVQSGSYSWIITAYFPTNNV